MEHSLRSAQTTQFTHCCDLCRFSAFDLGLTTLNTLSRACSNDAELLPSNLPRPFYPRKQSRNLPRGFCLSCLFTRTHAAPPLCVARPLRRSAAQKPKPMCGPHLTSRISSGTTNVPNCPLELTWRAVRASSRALPDRGDWAGWTFGAISFGF